MGLKRCMVILFSCLLFGCGGHHKQHKKNKTNVYVVRATTVHKLLYFTGTLEPRKEYTLTSPAEAVVESMPYHFGQRVKKGEVVFSLNSAELQKEYNETLTDYLKAKDNYTVARAKFVGTDDLWRAGLLAKNNYLSEKSSLNTVRVSLMQAKNKLTDLLQKMGEQTDKNVSHLSFADFDKVRVALMGKHNLIQIRSPGDGVLLYPPKSGDETVGHMAVGMTTKAGQVLGLIGDLSGVRVNIDVPEVDIDKIRPGMPATIRGVAFAKQALTGTLVAVNAQASVTSGSSLPSFTAIVEVNALDKKQQASIKVGMSASIELAVESRDKLLIPIVALLQKKGQSLVRIREPNGVLKTKTVTTGPVHGDKVVIDTGLKAGDTVIYDDV